MQVVYIGKQRRAEQPIIFYSLLTTVSVAAGKHNSNYAGPTI